MYRHKKLVLAFATLSLPTAILVAQDALQEPLPGLVQGPSALLAGAPKPDAMDMGPSVEMFESPNLDRFLRRARMFLDEEKYPEAIDVLQSVIEGRTLVAIVGEEGDQDAEATQDGERLADPSQTVFSQDGRIYRPARRLCHEYLSGMPRIGLTLYQTSYEAKAQGLLAEALASGRISALEHVANNYFVTLAAGEAMQILADRHMHEGRYRAAVQVLGDLSQLYPEENLRRLKISRLWCRFKMALCLRLAGEIGAGVEAAQRLAKDYPEESVRVMGELHTVKGLAAGPLFAQDEDIVAVVEGAVDSGPSWLRADNEDLVPLWQYRFHGINPYASGKSSTETQNTWMSGTPTINSAPYASKYGTGTSVTFAGDGYPTPRALFLEHFRLRQADAFTGLLVRDGDEPHQSPRPREGYPRARVPAYDFALQRAVQDGERVYVVVGYNKNSSSLSALKINHVVAYEDDTLRRLWSTNDFLEGEDSYEDVTFLSAPTVYGERLLMPVLRRGSYMLQCTDRRSGRPLWRARLHAGGSEFYKAPGTPVLVSGSLAYVLTNAGAIAAVDAFAGDLKWIRRYERADPLRPLPIVRQQVRQQGMFRGGQTQFQEKNLSYFLPSEMFAAAGTIVFAGCDGRMLLCVDGATGEPLWMIDGTCKYTPYEDIRYLAGSSGENLIAVSESHVVCIGLRSGLIKWSKSMPQASDQLTRWRGRGTVVDDQVVMPGDRELLVTSVDGKGDWRRLQLPSFGVGEEPLRGPNNLISKGPWLGVAYSGGIEVYSSSKMLTELAEHESDPLVRATYLVQAGGKGLEDGLAVLEEWLRGDAGDPEQRQKGQEQLVGLAREHSLREGAIAALDRIEPLVTERDNRMQWFLARLEVYKQIQDLVAYGKEQQRLYRYMEGKD